jgi:hypothetical protein
MEDISVLQKPGTITGRRVRNDFKVRNDYPESKKTDQLSRDNITEGDENLLTYLDWHGLANEPGMIVLSSKSHYYYDYEDFTDITTLVNLKKLNLIKSLKGFLVNVCNMLPPNTNFIGCFYDRHSKNGINHVSKMYKKLINFLDSKVEFDLDKQAVSRLFKTSGFRIIDMTEIDGLTYFRAQNM